MERNCLACEARLLEPFLSFGKTPLANSYLTAAEIPIEQTYPLDVAFCEWCYMVQLCDTVDPKVLYSNYSYLSSCSTTLLKHASELADEVCSTFKPSKVLEIASNDGYLLKFFKQKKVDVLGIEPAENVAQVAIENGIPTLVEFFTENTSSILGKFDVIIGNNILAHVPNINEFIRGVSSCLANNGVMIFEFPYLMSLINHLEFDTIYHEHVFYYSVLSLQNLLSRHDLEIFDIKLLDIHGGSLRIYVRSKGGLLSNDVVSSYIAQEIAVGMNRIDHYFAFADRVKDAASAFLDKLTDLAAKNLSIGAYGAPAKACTLLNYSRVGKDLISFTVDINHNKQFKLLPGIHIPIYPPSHLVTVMPDYCVVLSWNFFDEIKGQQKKYSDLGGQFILPISAQ